MNSFFHDQQRLDHKNRNPLPKADFQDFRGGGGGRPSGKSFAAGGVENENTNRLTSSDRRFDLRGYTRPTHDHRSTENTNSPLSPSVSATPEINHSMAVNVSSNVPRSSLSPHRNDYQRSQQRQPQSLDEQFARQSHRPTEFDKQRPQTVEQDHLSERMRLENNIRKLMADKEALVRDLEEARQIVEAACNKTAEAENKLLAEQRSTSQQRNCVDQITLEAEKLADENRKLRHENSKLSAHVLDARNLLDSSQGEIASLNKMISFLKRNDQHERGSQHTERDTQLGRHNINMTMSDFQTQLQRMKYENDEIQSSKESLLQQRQTLLAEKDSLLKDRNVYLKKLEHQETKLRVSENVLDRIQPKLQLLAEAEDENKKLKNTVELLKKNRDECISHNSKLLRENNELKDKASIGSDSLVKQLRIELRNTRKKVDKLTNNIYAQQQELKRHHQMNVKYHGLKRKMKRLKEIYSIPSGNDELFLSDGDDQNVSPLTSPRHNLVTPRHISAGTGRDLNRHRSKEKKSDLQPLNLSSEFDKIRLESQLGEQRGGNDGGNRRYDCILSDEFKYTNPETQKQLQGSQATEDTQSDMSSDHELVRAMATILARRNGENDTQKRPTFTQSLRNQNSSRPYHYEALSHSQPLNQNHSDNYSKLYDKYLASKPTNSAISDQNINRIKQTPLNNESNQPTIDAHRNHSQSMMSPQFKNRRSSQFTRSQDYLPSRTYGRTTSTSQSGPIKTTRLSSSAYNNSKPFTNDRGEHRARMVTFRESGYGRDTQISPSLRKTSPKRKWAKPLDPTTAVGFYPWK